MNLKIKILIAVIVISIAIISCGSTSNYNEQYNNRIIFKEASSYDKSLFINIVEIDGVEFVIASKGAIDSGIAITKLK